MPPCPGNILPKSLIPRYLFKDDSNKSPPIEDKINNCKNNKLSKGDIIDQKH